MKVRVSEVAAVKKKNGLYNKMYISLLLLLLLFKDGALVAQW